MMTLQEALAKVAKLIRLSQSSNANESALAAQMAQKILVRYNIDRAALAVDGDSDGVEEVIEDHEQMLDDGGQRIARWKPMLASRVAKANSCRVYIRASAVGIIGRASDVSKVRYLYDMLVREVDRLTATHGKGQGRSYCISFRVGVVTAIGEKLQEANAKVAAEMRAEHTGAALMRIDKALERLSEKDRAIDAWMAENMRLRSSSRSVGVNAAARRAGYAAGQSITLGNQRGALSRGSKQLSGARQN